MNRPMINTCAVCVYGLICGAGELGGPVMNWECRVAGVYNGRPKTRTVTVFAFAGYAFVIFAVLGIKDRVKFDVLTEWAIGLYCGATPLSLQPAHAASNPVITAADVTDVPALFVADPFMMSGTCFSR
jgi:hypothetical protein